MPATWCAMPNAQCWWSETDAKHVLAGAADAPPTAPIGYDMNLSIDYVMNMVYRIAILAHGGASSRDDPVGGAGSGVLRPRLVTAGSGGQGHRPPGTTTWLRGVRCTDPEAMPEMEARPPAKNRHGGAPRGERPASWDAPRLTRADRRVSQTRQQHKCACRRPAHPSLGWMRKEKREPGRNNAPRERTTLRCLTS